MSDRHESEDPHTVAVTIEREFQVPGDLVEAEHAEDYFWNYWGEFLGERPTEKDEIVDVEVN
ncbi:hypothetical protein [Halorarum salinum]|uniref:Uncharacterized protein n=1 Tax=Halorarum salinum TaxID=2743089 RepID=A0A7D5LBU3_9EURY|nr:hypothetical protein [Halobaculum salinum]QLG62850.1 hypothetical protein HUG12_14380 [Halobaculum salinum]